MVKTSKDKTISIRLSQGMLEAIDARAILDEKDRTQVIREAISQYLDLPEESIEDRIDVVEESFNSLYQHLGRLEKQFQQEIKRADTIETRLEELSRMMAVFLKRLK